MDAPKAMLIATLDLARDALVTAEPDTLLMFEPSAVYSSTLPGSGMTRDGLVFELPTPELPTIASGSSYLPTPNVAAISSDMEVTLSGDGREKPNKLGWAIALLPTPAAMNPNDGEDFSTWEARRVATKERVKNGNGFGTPLAIAVQLLPTPAANDSGNTPEQHLRKKPGRAIVTSLQVIVDHDLISTGGRIDPQSNGGSPFSDDSLPPQLDGMDELEQPA